MFKDFKKFISDTLVEFEKKVDSTITPIQLKVNEKISRPIQELSKKAEETASQIPKGFDLQKSKEILTSIKEETVKRTISVFNEGIEIPVEFYRDNVEIDAGLEFFQKYESDVALIQCNNRELFVKSEETDAKIVPVYKTCIQQNQIWIQIVKDFNSLDDVINGVSNIKNEIEKICRRVDLLEMALTEQSESVANLEIQTWKDFQNSKTQKYILNKKKEFELYEQEIRIGFVKREQQKLQIEKLKLQNQLEEKRIKAREKEREDRIREQQLVIERQKEEQKQREQLQQQFQTEFNAYKEHGILPPRREQPIRTLEQVDLPSDPSVEEFLGPKDPENDKKIEENDEETKKLLIVEENQSLENLNEKKEQKLEDVDESWYS